MPDKEQPAEGLHPDIESRVQEMKAEMKDAPPEKVAELQKELRDLLERERSRKNKERKDHIKDEKRMQEIEREFRLEPTKKTAAASPKNENEAPETFVERITRAFEHFRNLLGYQLAPIFESLGKLPFFESLNPLGMLLGRDRMALFAVLKKKKIEPEFHSDDPSKDSKPIDDLVAMAEKIHAANSQYTAKQFFETAATKFAEKKTGKVDMEELATFAKNEVYETELAEAKNMPKAPAEAPKDQAAQNPAKPEQQSTEMDVVASGANTVDIKRGTEVLHVALKNGAFEVGDDKKKWRLYLEDTTDDTLKGMKGNILPIETIAKGEKTLSIKIFSKELASLPQTEMPKLFESLKGNAVYRFEIPDGKNKHTVELRPAA